MCPEKARCETGAPTSSSHQPESSSAKGRILLSRRLLGVPHSPMTEAALEGIILRLLPAEPLWSLRCVSGTALVPQRLATVVAAGGFLGIELDRFHCSTFEFDCSQGSHFFNTWAG